MTYYIIIIMSLIIYFIEGLHDNRLEKLYNSKDELIYVKQWHKYDWIFHIFSVSLLSYVMFGISLEALLLLINVGFIRQLTLNSTLNLLKGKKIWYLGTTSEIDKILKKYEKLVFFALIMINIGFIFLLG